MEKMLLMFELARDKEDHSTAPLRGKLESAEERLAVLSIELARRSLVAEEDKRELQGKIALLMAEIERLSHLSGNPVDTPKITWDPAVGVASLVQLDVEIRRLHADQHETEELLRETEGELQDLLKALTIVSSDNKAMAKALADKAAPATKEDVENLQHYAEKIENKMLLMSLEMERISIVHHQKTETAQMALVLQKMELERQDHRDDLHVQEGSETKEHRGVVQHDNLGIVTEVRGILGSSSVFRGNRDMILLSLEVERLRHVKGENLLKLQNLRETLHNVKQEKIAADEENERLSRAFGCETEGIREQFKLTRRKVMATEEMMMLQCFELARRCENDPVRLNDLHAGICLRGMELERRLFEDSAKGRSEAGRVLLAAEFERLQQRGSTSDTGDIKEVKERHAIASVLHSLELERLWVEKDKLSRENATLRASEGGTGHRSAADLDKLTKDNLILEEKVRSLYDEKCDLEEQLMELRDQGNDKEWDMSWWGLEGNVTDIQKGYFDLHVQNILLAIEVERLSNITPAMFGSYHLSSPNRPSLSGAGPSGDLEPSAQKEDKMNSSNYSFGWS
jgi:hypothetical protein